MKYIFWQNYCTGGAAIAVSKSGAEKRRSRGSPCFRANFVNFAFSAFPNTSSSSQAGYKSIDEGFKAIGVLVLVLQRIGKLAEVT